MQVQKNYNLQFFSYKQCINNWKKHTKQCSYDIKALFSGTFMLMNSRWGIKSYCSFFFIAIIHAITCLLLLLYASLYLSQLSIILTVVCVHFQCSYALHKYQDDLKYSIYHVVESSQPMLHTKILFFFTLHPKAKDQLCLHIV